MERVGLYPGTFDPVTRGHVDIIERASRMMDRLIVGVSVREGKSPLFDLGERMSLLKASIAHLDTVEVRPFEGLLVDYAQSVGAQLVVRGLRAITDFEYEFQMALMNRSLAPDLETVFLMTHHEWIYLSSSLVKEIARHGGDVERFLPEPVATRLASKLGGDTTDELA